MTLLDQIGQRALFALDPETAHGLSIKALKSGFFRCNVPSHEALQVHIAGLSFPNPLGMAAGFDKNADVPDALLGLGFGFAEIGTITPKPQSGNPRPRIFRLIEDHAVINRLGFNNQGHDAAYERLAARTQKGIVGVNIGANKDSTNRPADYEEGISRFSSLASYITVNISSPNTPGLRGLQDKEALGELLTTVTQARAKQAKRPPIFLKIAPDLDFSALESIAEAVLASGIEGIIVSNTTIDRHDLRDRNAHQVGGLSGRPLFHASTIILAQMRQLVGPDLALIGVGGVETAEHVLEKIRAGADLVQLYTGMIYEGPKMPGRIIRDLVNYVEGKGLRDISSLRDSRTKHWAGLAAKD